MATNAVSKPNRLFPSVWDDFFKPWNEWSDRGQLSRTLTVPAVNITENKDEYKLSLAAPGLKKDDFRIDVDESMLTISSEKVEEKEEKDGKSTHKEYSYSSFYRSFTIPDDVKKEAVTASYTDGVLHIVLPKKEDVKKNATAKQITVK